jgi:choline dehydrogenase-like flavoprotein
VPAAGLIVAAVTEGGWCWWAGAIAAATLALINLSVCLLTERERCKPPDRRSDLAYGGVRRGRPCAQNSLRVHGLVRCRAGLVGPFGSQNGSQTPPAFQVREGVSVGVRTEAGHLACSGHERPRTEVNGGN